MTPDKKKVYLSVCEFALPAPRRGSIGSYSGFGSAYASEAGQIIHAVRQKFESEDPTYKFEVPLSHQFEKAEFIFEVHGRMDGVYQGRIEEIKSAFNLYELMKQFKEEGTSHPYILQLLTYGYIQYLQTKSIPTLNLHLVSTRNGDSTDYGVKLDLDHYEEWLSRRLDELVIEARSAEKRSARRKGVASNLKFPFENMRPGQLELMQKIEETIVNQKPHFIQAPTGLGKTMGVIYPMLKESLSRGQQTIYVTPKNSQHAVAEDAIEKLQNAGAKIKAMTFTAKSKSCLKNEPYCNAEYCEYAKDYYTKVASHGLKEKLLKKKSLTSKIFKKMGEEFEVCPFELQIDVAKEADAIICDYNYVFAPQSALGRIAGLEVEQSGKPNLAVDEAHNLISRSLDYYSPELSTDTLEKMRGDIQNLPEKYKNKTLKLLDRCIGVVTQAGPKALREPQVVYPPLVTFHELDEILREHLSNYLKSDTEILPRDPIMRLVFYWNGFTEMLQFISEGRKEFFTTYYPHPPSIKINCCDASEMLKDCYGNYNNVVSFSATLKPFEYYSRLSGLSEMTIKTSEFSSPFPRRNRKVLLIPQISSKYSERERNYKKIAEAIAKIVALRKGNYFAFFPSFDFMKRVFQIFSPPEGFETLVQYPQMRRDAVNEILETLTKPGLAHVVFGVQGGTLAEGMDYPGEMAIGAFIVGPPLPNFNLEREKMREYYQDNYEAGFEYAYAYPAMAKAVQAAGRVIRSETDKGLIVLMDNRFGFPSFSSSMPQDWFDENPGELVSESILDDVSKFWSQI